jgi:hypothetical protein
MANGPRLRSNLPASPNPPPVYETNCADGALWDATAPTRSSTLCLRAKLRCAPQVAQRPPPERRERRQPKKRKPNPRGGRGVLPASSVRVCHEGQGAGVEVTEGQAYMRHASAGAAAATTASSTPPQRNSAGSGSRHAPSPPHRRADAPTSLPTATATAASCRGQSPTR